MKKNSRSFLESLIGNKIAGTRIVPIATKIIIIFILFVLISNLTTNYINLVLNREELVKVLKEILVKDLKDLYTYANNQYEIYQFNKNKEESVEQIEKKAMYEFKKEKSVALGVETNGTFLFQASRVEHAEQFKDKESLQQMQSNLAAGKAEGYLPFRYNNEKYIGVYKYNKQWDTFIIRGEELNEFYARSWEIFRNIALVTLLITIACALIGMVLLKHILRFVRIITDSILQMTSHQQLELIDMKGAPNDDISFLGVSFNSLSATINNLLQVFRKFVNKDIALKAYREKYVKLEGARSELTCLFSDIKQFTYMTETLGSDIITLLNMHYDRAIREIINEDGIIGSIIGDALLAVYGALEDSTGNKSYQAIISAYKIQDVAQSLRENMIKIKNETERKEGKFSEQEERVYKAVLIEVGVGIDGGMVFYGNIGSYERMTNTVIGDNVNSSSRLEGLTRVYKVPVIVSEYVKTDIEENIVNHGITFLEIDTVQVKGKTVGKKVYWPIMEEHKTRKFSKDIATFDLAREHYYKGQWRKAEKLFKDCSLNIADVFLDRIKNKPCPKDWNGIWTMTTK